MGDGEIQNQKNSQASGKIRAFIAVCLPSDVISDLSDLQARLRKFGIKMKYTDPENIHLTLKFLGSVPVPAVDRISASLGEAAAGFGHMQLYARGLGAFPGVRRARVMWTGVGGHTGQLEGLHQAVENHMAELGFPEEDRGFAGHLTLGRFKPGADPVRIAGAIEEFGDFASNSFDVFSVELFESILTRGGPVYKVAVSHRLAADRLD